MPTMPMLRPWLQRLLDRFNASIVPVVLVPRKRHEGCLSRWELFVLTLKKTAIDRGCSNSAPRVVLSFWREAPPWQVGWRERRPGSLALPFQHEQDAEELRARFREAVQRGDGPAR